MSFTEKMDVLDLLINILKEHEETLDKLVTRLETVSDIIKILPPKEDPNLLVFNLDDVKKNLKDVMQNYDIDAEITESMLRLIWYEVHTESIVTRMNERIYDACVDYVQENLK